MCVWQIVTNNIAYGRPGYKRGYNMKNMKRKYSDFLEWKRDKEAIYHIEILP